jgi:hypothetical protein
MGLTSKSSTAKDVLMQDVSTGEPSSSNTTNLEGGIFTAVPQDHSGFPFGSQQEMPTGQASGSSVSNATALVEQMQGLTLTKVYRCSVCEGSRAAAELYDDGDYLAWKSYDAKRTRTEYWCLACAFPTCASCAIKTKTAVKRRKDFFVNLTSREWYL